MISFCFGRNQSALRQGFRPGENACDGALAPGPHSGLPVPPPRERAGEGVPHRRDPWDGRPRRAPGPGPSGGGRQFPSALYSAGKQVSSWKRLDDLPRRWGICYGCVTKVQKPLTKKKLSDKVASQDDEGLGEPSTDTGTASHGMCARERRKPPSLEKNVGTI